MKFELPPPLPDEATIQRQRREKKESDAHRANKAELEGHQNRVGSIHKRSDADQKPPSTSGGNPEKADRSQNSSSNVETVPTKQSRTDDSGTNWSFLRQDKKTEETRESWSEEADWSFLKEKAERPANSRDTSATSEDNRLDALTILQAWAPEGILIGLGILIIAALCLLWWDYSHYSRSTFQSPDSAQDSSQTAIANSSEAAASPTSSPNSDGSTQPGTQPTDIIAAATPSPTSSPNPVGSTQGATQQTETTASAATPSPTASPNSNTNSQRGTHPNKQHGTHTRRKAVKKTN
jgi:hypothetical protein